MLFRSLVDDVAGGAVVHVGDALGRRCTHAHEGTTGARVCHMFAPRLGRGRGLGVSVRGVRVWIDQDLCTGDGLCLDHCPDVFVQLEDGIAYVAESGQALNDPGGSGSLAWVPLKHYQAVVDAAEACPGECIFIEMPAVAAGELRASA